MKAFKKATAGFGMLEVLISTFLVILGLLVVLSSIVATAKASRYSERMDVANTLARREMERVRNLNFDAILSEEGAYGEYTEIPDFRHEVTVSNVGTLKEVLVRIHFENDRRSAQIVTFVANL